MTDNGLNNYLDEIGQEKLLTDEQERELSERIKQGDQRALGRLVQANLRFVVKLATLYRGQGLQLDDLISEGNLGLMAAAAKFDASRGTRFVVFAAPYVRRQIERAIEEQNGKKEPKIAFSTTNYHVFRSGILASEQGIHAEGIGAHTKSYFWINAFIREFIASLYYEYRIHMRILVSFVLLMIAMIGLVYISVLL